MWEAEVLRQERCPEAKARGGLGCDERDRESGRRLDPGTHRRTHRKEGCGTPEAHAGAISLQVKELQGRLGATGLEGAGGSRPGLQTTLFLDFWFQAARDMEGATAYSWNRGPGGGATTALLLVAPTVVPRKLLGEQKQVTSVAGYQEPK